MLAAIRHYRRAVDFARTQAEAEAAARDPSRSEALQRADRDRAADAQAEARRAALWALVAGVLTVWALLCIRAAVRASAQARGWDAYVAAPGLAPADVAGALRSGVLERTGAWGELLSVAVVLAATEGGAALALVGRARRSLQRRYASAPHTTSTSVPPGIIRSSSAASSGSAPEPRR